MIVSKVVSLNPAHGEVCSIQLYVIHLVSGLRHVAPVNIYVLCLGD